MLSSYLNLHSYSTLDLVEGMGSKLEAVKIPFDMNNFFVVWKLQSLKCKVCEIRLE